MSFTKVAPGTIAKLNRDERTYTPLYRDSMNRQGRKQFIDFWNSEPAPLVHRIRWAEKHVALMADMVSRFGTDGAKLNYVKAVYCLKKLQGLCG
ncbi:hypothetical protein AGMMS49940_22620 [Spirochaetia bacterium]|nr:hypothetical protein AGMMS49940_22620 [Spirochaetia bacterium]